MKTGERILSDFIKDFYPEIPGLSVCFTASVEFKTTSVLKKFKCEVHIIPMREKQLNMLYLLHRELNKSSIPNTFFFDPTNFLMKSRRLSLS